MHACQRVSRRHFHRDGQDDGVEAASVQPGAISATKVGEGKGENIAAG
jgi:hypothetical protein